jgi:hypothetical protein
VIIVAPLVSADALQAGAAQSVITPELLRGHAGYLAGFGHNRVATGVHDDLYTRCLALGTGTQTLAICSADLIGLSYDDGLTIRRAGLVALGANLVASVTTGARVLLPISNRSCVPRRSQSTRPRQRRSSKPASIFVAGRSPSRHHPTDEDPRDQTQRQRRRHCFYRVTFDTLRGIVHEFLSEIAAPLDGELYGTYPLVNRFRHRRRSA